MLVHSHWQKVFPVSESLTDVHMSPSLITQVCGRFSSNSNAGQARRLHVKLVTQRIQRRKTPRKRNETFCSIRGVCHRRHFDAIFPWQFVVVLLSAVPSIER